MDLIKHKNEICDYIDKKIVPKHTNIRKCTIHVLPESLEKELEIIINAYLSCDADDLNEIKNIVQDEIEKKFSLTPNELSKILLLVVY